MLYGVIGLQFLMVILFVLSLFRAHGKSKKSTLFSSYYIKIMSIYGILINTAGFIPFFNILAAALYCNTSSKTGANLGCYSGLYLLHFSLAIPAMIILLFFTFLFMRFYIELNPNSSLPFAQP